MSESRAGVPAAAAATGLLAELLPAIPQRPEASAHHVAAGAAASAATVPRECKQPLLMWKAVHWTSSAPQVPAPSSTVLCRAPPPALTALVSLLTPAGRVWGPRQRAPPAKVEEWVRRVQYNRMGDKLQALRKEHKDLGLPL